MKFGVKFYSDDEEKKLQKTGLHSRFKHLVDNGFECGENDLLSYGMFREHKDAPGYRNYSELSKKADSRREIIQDYFELNSGHLRSIFNRGEDSDPWVTEMMGVGAGLALCSEAYGLTEADWQKIPISGEKDLDFEIAATGSDFVKMEAKGTIYKNSNDRKSLAGHASRVRKKKEQQNVKHPSSSLIGVITAFPEEQEDPCCYLMDPPAPNIEWDPAFYRIVARLYYYYKNIHSVLKSHMLIALINRIHDMISIGSYKEFEGKPLLNVNGNPFKVPNSAYNLRTNILGESFCEVFPISNREGEAFIWGMDYSILSLLVEQNFEGILEYSSKLSKSYSGTTIARVTLQNAKRLGIKPNSENSIGRNRIAVPCKIKVIRNTAGKVFGLIQVAG
ncbi:MAG: hypothetical protein K9M49_02155 [Candidatus Marinimicrobia bacterium]|nr:hypothetical protein [Candidatus Neomarinimicrobiota bacterium]MCF7903934.1 hypothetical protein [Candidatus Neomarinimicrobiota bacterium]